MATDIDLFDTYVGGSRECIGAILDHLGLEALDTGLDARADFDGDKVNIWKEFQGCRIDDGTAAFPYQRQSVAQ